MKVTLLAATTWGLYDVPEEMEDWDHGTALDTKAADWLAELSGRACYSSWSRPNPETAANKAYLANIIARGHLSVLEHASATFYVEGVSRSLLAELTRHRHLSFSVLSQRFVDSVNAGVVLPPALDGTDTGTNVGHFVSIAIEFYENITNELLASGLGRKQAREAARAVLPNCIETKIVLTGNHRAFREMLAKRTSPSADAEFQEFARELLRQLKEIAPNTYQDM